MNATGLGLSDRVVTEFHALCNHAYEAWLTHRILFDNNPRVADLETGRAAPFFVRLSIITQEYALQQIAKLHDPAVQQGRKNLTLEYALRFGAWDAATTQALEAMLKDLEVFAKQIKPARNRVLSHNDLEFILDSEEPGGFKKDADRRYFETLQEFVNKVHEQTVGGPKPFCVRAEGDVFMFLKELQSDEAADSVGA